MKARLRQLSTLQIALIVSVLLHAALLTLRVADPERFNRMFDSGALDVVLVNTSSAEKPDKARAIAQTSLAGGGNTPRARASSPLPSALESVDSVESGSQQQQLLRELQARQTQLLAQVKAMLAAPAPNDSTRSISATEQAQEIERRQQLIKMLAQIERRIQADNDLPRKRYISPATREAPYALYYDRMRRTIEDKGTANFPQARGQKMYGSLVMIIHVNQRGRLISTEIVLGSGNRDLDRRAQAIVQAASPFGEFSPAMRESADVVAVVSRFNFSQDNTLSTRSSVAP